MQTRRLLSVALLLGALVTFPAIAQPTFSKTFTLDTIGPGSTTTLRFDIVNNSGTPVTDLAFTDTLPAGVTIASVPATFSTCGAGATLSAPAGGTTITFSDGTLGAGASCRVRVDVTGTTVGTHMNTSGTLTSSAGSSGTATDDLNVVSTLPGFSKSFSPSSVSLGGRSTLSFTIDNRANASAVLNLDFTDNLPTGLTVASPANASTTCGTPTIPATLTATAGTSVIILDADGTAAFPAVAAGGRCTVSVDVTPSSIGTLGNRSEQLLAEFVEAGRASAPLAVTAAVLTIEKAFTDDPVPPGDTVNLQFTIRNLNRTDTATSVTFTDNLDAALTGLAAIAPFPTNPCGSGSTLTGTTTLTLSNGTIAPESSCTFSVTLQVPGGATPGSYTNTTSNVSGNVGGVPTSGNQATEQLFVEPIPILTKEFTDDPVGTGNDVTLRFTVTNTSTTGSATNIAFTDQLTDFLPFPVTVTLPPVPDPPCGAGSSASLVGCGTDCQALSLTNGTLAAGASCVFDVLVGIPPGFPAGTVTNVTESITADVDGATRTGAPASDDLVVVAAPTLSKEFTDDPVQPGDTVTLEFTLTSDTDLPGDATGIAFTDDLSFLAGLAYNGPTLNDICGTGSQLSGTTLLSFSGGTLAPDSTCTFSVPLDVPAGAPLGSFTNQPSDVTATILGTPATGLSGSDDLVVTALRFTKVFTSEPAIPGGTTTIDFMIENLSTTDTATLNFFTDNFDASVPNMTVVPGSVPANPCGAGSSITLSGGNEVMSFFNGTLAPSTSCTFSLTLDVPAATPTGTYNNITSNLSATVGGSNVTVAPATDELDVIAEPLFLTKSFVDDPVAPGGNVTLEFTIDNLDPAQAASAIDFTDNLGDVGGALSGLAATGLPVAACGGTLSGTTTLTFTGGSVAAGGTCTFSATLDVPAAASPGTFTNTTSQINGTIGGIGVTGSPASDDLLVQNVNFTKSFDGPTSATGTAQLTFSIDNLDSTNPISDLAFTDNLGSTLVGLSSTSGTQNDVCGVGSSISGTSTLTFSGGTLPASGSCSFAVTVQVPAGATPGSYPNTTSNLTSAGLTIADPATDNLLVEPPPTFSKTFNPAFIGLGQTSTISFVIDNSASAVTASSLAFTDNLPAGVSVSNLPNVVNGCGGTVTAPSGSTSISLAGGSVASGASCTIQVDVIGNATGAHVNTTGNLTSSSGDSGTASDTLTVNPQPLFSKAFNPAAIAPGASSTLTFTIDNTASSVDATSISFSDNLPTSVVIAAAPNASTTCSGGTLTAPANGVTISYSGGTVGAGTSCTVAVDVTSATPGSHTNTSGNLTSSLGNSGTASDTLVVPTAPTFTKAFAPSTIPIAGTSSLSFTIDNSTSAVDATSLDFTDNLPAGVLVATPSNATTSCTGGTLTAADGSGSISYSGGAVGAGASCTVSVDVTSATPGSYVNTSGDLTSSLGNSGAASDTLTVDPVPLFTKSFAPAVIDPGMVSTLTFTIDNTMNLLDATAVDFTDALPGDVTVATPSNATTDCTGGTLTATDGSGTISYTGGTVAAGRSCTISVDVTALIAGMHDNVSGDLTSSLGNSGPASATLTVNQPLTLSKAFVPSMVLQLQTTRVILTLDNSAGALDATNVGVADLLPSGLEVANPANATTTCVGGTLTATPGASSFDYIGGTVPAGTSCTVEVDVLVISAGTIVNVTQDLTSSFGNSGPASSTLSSAATPAAIPTLDFWAAILLGLLLVIPALRLLR